MLGEECKEALGLAEKLRDKKRIQDISDYQKLIEVLGTAEDAFGKENMKQPGTAI